MVGLERFGSIGFAVKSRARLKALDLWQFIWNRNPTVLRFDYEKSFNPTVIGGGDRKSQIIA